MKQIIILIVCLFGINVLHAKTNGDLRVYVNDNNTESSPCTHIVLKNDTLFFYSLNIEMSLHYLFKYGECELTHIKDDFFKISSIDGSVLSVRNNLSISYPTDSTSGIIFDFPNLSNKYSISIIPYDDQSTDSDCIFLDYEMQGGKLRIPDEVTKSGNFLLKIQPLYMLISPLSNNNGKYYGVVSMNIPIYLKQAKSISIGGGYNIGDLNFIEFYIVDDIIQIDEKHIIWEGVTFKRDHYKYPNGFFSGL